jgi:predicted secreted hydrolase
MPKRNHISLTSLVILALLLPIATSCALRPASARGLVAAPPAPTPTPLPAIQFPLDEAPHNSLSEWWYYTGHLDAAEGGTYGFELVIFQAVRQGYPVGYAAHFAVTDYSTRSFRYFQRQASSMAIQGGGKYDVAVGDWRLQGEGGNDHLSAGESGYALDLAAAAVKPVTLQGGTGIISFGPAGSSYYYSRTRMAATGTLTVDGVRKQVTGTAWMDHQWGDFVVGGGGWDWHAYQLDDGSELMISAVRSASDQPIPQISYATYVDPSGVATSLPIGDVLATATGSWTSPTTGITYPSGWQVRVERLDLSLDVQPAIPDQELDARQSTGNVYWEGAGSIAGTKGGASVGGRGYVELTGYGS